MTFRAIALAIAGAAIASSVVLVSPAPARAASRVPLPTDRLHFGLGNDRGHESWFTASGVPWRYRYTYLAGGVNNVSNATYNVM